MGDPLGSSHVSSQKQNHEGVAQSGQYLATTKPDWDVTKFGIRATLPFGADVPVGTPDSP